MNTRLLVILGLACLFGCTSPNTADDTNAGSSDPVSDVSQSENSDVDEAEGGVTQPDELGSEPAESPSEDAETDTVDADPRVRLTVFTESLCPCAAQWIYDFRESVLPAVGDIIRIERYVDGSAHDDGSVTSFHGSREVFLQQNEVCVQHLAAEQGDSDGGYLASLLWTACINGACSGPGGSFGLEFCEHQGNVDEEGDNDTARACAAELGLDWDELLSCATGELGQQLHWDSSSYGNTGEVTYGMQGLPVVWINAERHSEFWDCNSHSDSLAGLIGLVCDLYEGPERPEACQD